MFILKISGLIGAQFSLSIPFVINSKSFLLYSISGTSSGKEKAVVASLACSPNGRCSNVNVNGIGLEYVFLSLPVAIMAWLSDVIQFL